MKTTHLMYLLLFPILTPAHAGETASIDLTRIDRAIVKEPAYANAPHYALIVIGPRAEHRSWLVMDGDEILYFDRNGNGDLTEAEDRIAQDTEATRKNRMAEGSTHTSMNVFPLGNVAGVQLSFNYWVRRKGFVPQDERLRKIMQEREANDWENSTLWRIAANGSRAQNPILLTSRSSDAQVTHLEGPLTFALKWGEGQKLQPWPKNTTFDVHIGTPALPPRNCSHALFSPLTDTEVPRDVHPTAVFEFPPRSPGAKPVLRTIELDLRCCGDTVYARMAVPREAGEGTAKVTLAYAGWKERVVHPATFQVPIGGQLEGGEAEVSYIMYHDPDGSIRLDDAMTALRARGMTVRKVANGQFEGLLISRKNQSAFAVTLNRGPEVLETSRALGEGSPFVEVLGRCNARLEISILPGTIVTETAERPSLADIHAALRVETQGILYTMPDKQLLGPE